jgi:hypothetical protein
MNDDFFNGFLLGIFVVMAMFFVAGVI